MTALAESWLGKAIVLACALIVVAIGAVACFYAGFAWAVLICVCVGWLIGQKRVEPHEQLEAGIVVICCWILLAVGIFLGLVLRLVLQ